MNAFDEYVYWLENATEAEIAEQLRALDKTAGKSAIEDAFFQHLEFGTAGLRGIIGAGTNRMNIYTVGRATQGLAQYLLAHNDTNELRVAIACDSRHKGKEFVEHAACVLAANGITVYVFERIEPTPALSFAVRDLECAAGICMTASHNPAEYNGYKVYNEHGCQITSQVAKDISEAISSIDYFTGVNVCAFDEALKSGMIKWIGDDTLDRYIEAVYAACPAYTASKDTSLRIAYTPLHGTGLECTKRALEGKGFTVCYVEEQLQPDGDFPTCPYPNPETKEALEKGIHFAQQNACDLVLATDPDADRVGVAVKEGENFELLTGNEMGILMFDYLCSIKRETNSMPSMPLVVTTIVSSAMIDALAATYGVEVRRVLTGFKYIGDIITELEGKGKQENFILGFEESYGYLTGDHVRDKDAINAGLVICQMAQWYKEKGLTLFQAIEKLYEAYGFYANRTINVAFPGAQGSATMANLMQKLRENPPRSIASMNVEETIDYGQSKDGLPAANVIEFRLGKGRKVIFRPSGTEPKVKAYLFAQAQSHHDTQSMLDALEADARALMN